MARDLNHIYVWVPALGAQLLGSSSGWHPSIYQISEPWVFINKGGGASINCTQKFVHFFQMELSQSGLTVSILLNPYTFIHKMKENNARVLRWAVSLWSPHMIVIVLYWLIEKIHNNEKFNLIMLSVHVDLWNPCILQGLLAPRLETTDKRLRNPPGNSRKMHSSLCSASGRSVPYLDLPLVDPSLSPIMVIQSLHQSILVSIHIWPSM